VSNLSIEKRAEVARAVTGLSFAAEGESIETPTSYDYNGSPRGGDVWNPSYNSDQWQKLVEWLADRIYKEPEVGPKDPQIRDASRALILWNAIRSRRVDWLESLCSELLSEQV